MAWVPLAGAGGAILGGLFGRKKNKAAEAAIAAANQARQAAAAAKARADELERQVAQYRTDQEELKQRLQREMDARAEQDEKHNEAMREMEERYNAQRDQHREEMKEFRKEALESEKRMLGERLQELTRESKRLNRIYQQNFGALENLALQVKSETDKMQQFRPELEDESIKKIVLLGLTGDGKSTLGNRLVGDRSEDGDQGPFATSGHVESKTQAVCKYINELYGVKVSVVDTPGISDSNGHGRDREHITNLVEYLRGCGGVNQFLILKNSANPRLSNVYMGMLRELDRILGKDFWRYVTVVLTHVDDRRAIRRFEQHRNELCAQLSEEFGAQVGGIGIGLDDYDDVLSDLVTRIVPLDDKFICENLISPLEELEARLAADKERLVAEKHELDVVGAKIEQVKTGLRDVEQKLTELR